LKYYLAAAENVILFLNLTRVAGLFLARESSGRRFKEDKRRFFPSSVGRGHQATQLRDLSGVVFPYSLFTGKLKFVCFAFGVLLAANTIINTRAFYKHFGTAQM
jgi:hypothetical protein